MFFGRETNRVIREKWNDLNSFAEELWAVFQGDLPVNQNAPVTITQQGSNPPLVIKQPEGTDVPPIQIQRGDTTVTLGGLGGGSGGGGGGVDLGTITFPNPDPSIALATPAAADTPFVLYGELVGQVSGNTYSVRVWGKSPQGNPAMAVIPVRFPQVDPADTLPNTFLPVVILCFPGTVAGTRTVADAVAIAPVYVPGAS